MLGVPSVLVFNGGAYVSDTNGDLTVLDKDTNETEVLPQIDFILKTTKIKLKK